MTPALIWNFARQELIDRYAGSSLGFTWAFIQPLVLLFIFVVIFGGIMGSRLPGVENSWGYSIYLISGMLPWLAFSSTLTRTATVFTAKKHVLSKVGLSLPLIPLFIVVAETITFLIALGLFFLFLIILQHPWRPEVLLLVPVFAIQQALAMGLGLLLATLNVFLKDVREFVNVFMQLWFWITPLVWVPSIVGDGLYGYLQVLNPLVPLTVAYHSMFVGDRTIDYLSLGLVGALAGLMLGLGLLVVRVLEREIRDTL